MFSYYVLVSCAWSSDPPFVCNTRARFQSKIWIFNKYLLINVSFFGFFIFFCNHLRREWNNNTYLRSVCIQYTRARLPLFGILPFQIHMCVTIALMITKIMINNPHLTVSQRTTHSFNNKIRSNKLII